MLRHLRWWIASWIAPEMAPAAPELRSSLQEIYNWTAHKDSLWAKRAKNALDKARP
jgi:hypothetical protein